MDERGTDRAERAEGKGSGRDPTGALFVALAALQFGGTVTIGKVLANRGVPVPSMLSVRFGMSAVLLGLALLVTGRSLRPAPGEGRRLVALGGIGYALESALFFAGLHHGSASAVTLLFFTYPVWIAVVSLAVGLGRPGPLVVASLMAALAGAGLVVGGSGGLVVSTPAVLFSVGAALAFSVYLIGAEVSLRDTSPMVSSMWIAGAASVALAAFALVTGQARLPRGVEWVALAGMGAFTAGAFACLFVGLRRLGALRTSIVAALEPVAAAVLSAVFLDEPLRFATVGGGALILAGAVTASVARHGAITEPEAAVP